jgi:hypothetical protein
MPRYRRHQPTTPWPHWIRHHARLSAAEVALVVPRCPTCGQERSRRIVGAYRHGRAVIGPYRRWGDTPGPSARPIRIPKNRVRRGWRNSAECVDPFHDHRPPAAPATPRGRIGDNSDLRQAKARLSRDLQGKDRR